VGTLEIKQRFRAHNQGRHRWQPHGATLPAYFTQGAVELRIAMVGVLERLDYSPPGQYLAVRPLTAEELFIQDCAFSGCDRPA
jgi:hypothetical protein